MNHWFQTYLIQSDQLKDALPVYSGTCQQRDSRLDSVKSFFMPVIQSNANSQASAASALVTDAPCRKVIPSRKRPAVSKAKQTLKHRKASF